VHEPLAVADPRVEAAGELASARKTYLLRDLKFDVIPNKLVRRSVSLFENNAHCLHIETKIEQRRAVMHADLDFVLVEPVAESLIGRISRASFAEQTSQLYRCIETWPLFSILATFTSAPDDVGAGMAP
jgi:hypothetical protein